MKHHDQPLGKIFSRREAVALIGTSALTWLTCTPHEKAHASNDVPLSGSCIVRPELTEGPYYLDTNLDRSDIRSDSTTGETKSGISLDLTFSVSQLKNDNCVPLANALVDIWHCDALGNYSGVEDLPDQNFLRGYQLTNEDGIAKFTTIYPGWYPGRAVHIHFKVRSSATSNSAYVFTSQLFFNDELSTEVYQNEPYLTKGQQDLLNTQDGIYSHSDGDALIAISNSENGYVGEFNVAMVI